MLTIVCLSLSMVLIVIGTLAQAEAGIFHVMDTYFHTLFIRWQPDGSNLNIPVFPGGYLIGGTLVINLICAHFTRFKWTWRKSGIWMTHVGLILLLIGGLFTSLLSIETRMILTEGDSKNYSIDERDTELVVIYSHDDELDEVVSVPQSGLKKGKILQPESLPFSLHIKEFYTNSDLLEAEKHGLEPSEVNRGLGNGMAIKRRSDEISDNRINIVSAVVEIKDGQGDSQGIWLLSNGMITNSSNGEVIEQSFAYKDNTYRLVLRQKRYYNTYTIKLLDFSHDRYAGTDKPKNFSSEIILAQDDLKLNRKVLIYMNHPLRHGGKTYYQAGFNKETTTILQVVQNPSWLMPYISCTIITLGLLLQFFLHLSQFLKRKLANS